MSGNGTDQESRGGTMNWIPVSELPPDDFLDRRYIIWVSDGKWSHWNRGYFDPIDKTWAAPLFASEEKTVTHYCEITPPGESLPLTPEQAEEFRRERDETLVDLDFARRVCAEFYQHKHLLIEDCTDHYLYQFLCGTIVLYLDGVLVARNPTVGEFWTLIRLHKITLLEKNNGN